jgi:uncharacterized protein (TIGR01244 family)
MRYRLSLCLAVLVGILVSPLLAGVATQEPVTKETVTGVTNFAQIESTVACAGATSGEAMPELKEMGFASVFNLRLETEPGANVAEAASAARAAGLNYIHLPFSGQSPDPAVADRFVAEIAKPENQPAFIHCAGGNRAAVMWLIKRLVVDGWETERAVAEATALGMRSEALRQFAIDYAAGRERP